MKEEERHRKFHSALLKTLYPPPSPPPPHQEDDGQEVENLIEQSTDSPEEDLENEESCSLLDSNDTNCENGSTDQKLTRAQRKRLRKRKLKEATLQRRKVIGPLLPASNDGSDHIHDGVEVLNNISEGVRQNAAIDFSGETAASTKKNKLKQRRKSKKFADAKLTSSATENGATNQRQALELETGDGIGA